MADMTPPAAPQGPITPEAFIADRQRTWSAFTGFATYVAMAVVALLVGMAYFLA
jgi:hypothetical protein